MNDDALTARLDKAAIALLDEAFPEKLNAQPIADTNTSEGVEAATPSLDLKAKTAVFQAVCGYLSSRAKKPPGKRAQGKIGDYRDDLAGNSRTTGRRGTSTARAPQSGQDAGSA